MKFLTKKIIFSGLGVILGIGFWLSSSSFVSGVACTDHTFLGWAWSENVGWVSFSCKNTSTTIDYGVDKDPSTGLLSGQAWAGNIGWISFNSAELAGCPSGACEARMSNSTYAISGWARALAASSSASGWDGWIKLNGTATDASSTPYGVAMNNSTKELYGWAWGGNTANAVSAGVIGWLSFNCSNRSSCGTIDYHVHLAGSTPTVANLTPPANISANYCGDSASFEWLYQDPGGSSLNNYQFRVNTTGNASDTNPAVDLSITGRNDPVNSTTTQQIVVKIIPGANQLSYNISTYYWWVKVCNQSGACSDWTQGPNFSTPERHYPIARVAWDKETISISETVQFCSTADVANPNDPCYSTCWTTSTTPVIVSPDNPSWACSVCFDSSNNYIACQEVGSSYIWDLSSMTTGDYEFVSSTAVSVNPQIRFLTAGKNREVGLDITTGSSSCSGSKLLNANLPIPRWKETSPF